MARKELSNVVDKQGNRIPVEDVQRKLMDYAKSLDNEQYKAMKEGRDKLSEDNKALMRVITILTEELENARRRLALFESPSSHRPYGAPVPTHLGYTDIG